MQGRQSTICWRCFSSLGGKEMQLSWPGGGGEGGDGERRTERRVRRGRETHTETPLGCQDPREETSRRLLVEGGTRKTSQSEKAPQYQTEFPSVAHLESSRLHPERWQ